MRQIEADLGELFEEHKRTIRVGALPVAAHGLLPTVISDATDRGSHLGVEVIEGLTTQLLPALHSGEIDVVVGRLYEPDAPDGLIRRALYSEPVGLIARSDHPLFELDGVTAEDVRRFHVVSPAVSTRVEHDVRTALSAMQVDLDVSIRSTSVGFMRELLLTGNFISAMPKVLVAGDLERGLLRLIPIPLPAPPRRAGIIYREGLSDAGKLLVAAIGREVERLAASGIIDAFNED